MPTPPKPDALQQFINPLAFPTRQWRAAFWLGLVYLLLLCLLFLADIWPMKLSLFMYLEGAPPYVPFVVAYFLIYAIPPVLAGMNVLPVVGCALAMRGRPPRGPLQIYVAVQGCLVMLLLAAAAYAAWHGPFEYSYGYNANRTQWSISSRLVSFRAFYVAAAVSMLLSLPLLAMGVAWAKYRIAGTAA